MLKVILYRIIPYVDGTRGRMTIRNGKTAVKTPLIYFPVHNRIIVRGSKASIYSIAITALGLSSISR